MTNRIASEDIRVYILENNHPFTYKLVQLMKTARILFSASLLLVLSLANVPAADEAAVTPSPAPKAPKAKAVTESREKKDSTESKEVKPEAPPTVPDAELGTVPQKIWQKPWPSDLKQVLANPSDRLILYSLEPMESPERGEEALHGFKVLSKMYMRPEHARTAIAAFQDSINNWDSKMAKCFKPRQALVANENGHKYEILLCYSCQQMQVFRDGEKIHTYGVAGNPKVLKDLFRKAGKVISTTDPSRS